MDNETWQEFVGHLVDAKRSLGQAWMILDGTDGPAPGADRGFSIATDGIDLVFAIESTNDYNADVATPPDVQEFWDKTEQLPGFALGT